MTLHESAAPAAVLAVGLAVAARAARAVTWDGAVAGVVVGCAVASGFGVPGLVVLGTFFVGGSVATRIGYGRKAARGTAEAGGGARDARRVLGKGGVAAVIAAAAAIGPREGAAFAGAVAAALADTLGTEIGSLARGAPRTLPTFRPAPHGTPGAVSVPGLVAGAVGALVVAGSAALPGDALGAPPVVAATAGQLAAIATGGFAGAVLESVVVGVAPQFRNLPNWVRNVVPTAAGAVCAALGAAAFAGDPA